MRSSSPPFRRWRIAVAMANTRAWILSAVAVSAVVFLALIQIHLYDEKVRADALESVRMFREARIDLSQGLMHIAFAGPPEVPFDRAQGFALLKQALSSLDRTVVVARLSEQERAWLLQAISEVADLLSSWTAAGQLDPSHATQMRISLHQLDLLADQADERLRTDLRDMTDRHAKLFRIALGAAALLLIAMWIVILRVNAARERSLADQRRGESELRRWADAFENAGIGIAISEPGSSTIQFANTAYAKMRGMTVEEVCGCGIDELYTAEEAERIHRMVPICDSQGQLSYESRYRHKNGTTFPVLVHVVSVRDERGGIRYRVSTPIDITDLKRAQLELAEAQKMEAIGQLTGGVAHDFNNMLTVISGTVDILIDGVADRPQLTTIARLIDQAAMRGADLTRQLLAFARRQPLAPQPTDIGALITETIQLLRNTLGAQVQIDVRLGADVWPGMIDPSQLSNALINLAVNARDAMPGGGRLTFTCTNATSVETPVLGDANVTPGDYVMIAVADTGVGIPADLQSKVFEPFFTTKSAGKGTGLGLSMVYGFIKQSGGHIVLDSAEGRGTTIELFLPRSEIHPASLDETSAETTPCGHETVLVVEDDKMVRSYVVAQLHGLGYRTLTAVDGPSALALVEAGAAFDLLFTDVVMPGMNGRQLAEEVLRRHPDMPVLYTTGYTENVVLPYSRAAVLAKPYRKSELARKLREVLTPTRATG